MDTKIVSSAPGKLMIMGEHAVVYGKPCIVTAVESRIDVSIEKTNRKCTEYDTPGVADTRFLDAVIVNARKKWNIPSGGLKVCTRSGFSTSFGFGSSSAVTVACAHALAKAFSRKVDEKDIFSLAYASVLDVQGVGSGFDVASAVYGGTIVYEKPGTHIESLQNNANLVIGYTGVKADTVTLVKEVGKKYAAYKERMDRIFDAIATLVQQAKVAWEKNDWETVGKFMNFNQEYLRDLGVSTQKLEDLIVAAKQAGAYGAKLSGAGGGDCMIALVSDQTRSVVEQAIIGAGGEVLHVGVHAGGVNNVTTDDQTELFIVVDERDTVLGYRSRYECHHDKTCIHRTVGVAVFDSTGRVLLQKRSETKDMDAGKWGMSCAGHVTKGESYEVSAKRELQEELGIDIPFVHGTKFMTKDPHESEMAMLYTAAYNGPFHIDERETSEVKFFSKSEILEMLKFNQTAVTQGTIEGLKAIHFL